MNDLRVQGRVDRRPPAPHNNRAPLLVVALATTTALVVLLVFFWMMATRDSVPQVAASPEGAVPAEPPPAAEPSAEPTPQPAPQPTPQAPPAPTSDQLTSDGWLLSPYSVRRLDGNLQISGTLTNQAGVARSADVVVWAYVDGAPVGTGTTQVLDVPAGGSVDVVLPTGSPFVSGDKILVLSATPVP